MNQHYFRCQNATESFKQLATLLIDSPQYKVKPRGMLIHEALNVIVQINNPRDRLIYTKARKTSLSYLVGEWLWYERATAQLRDISYYSSFWEKVSDDGITVTSCYGKKLYHKQQGYSQWDRVREILKSDKDTRRAVLLLSEPHDVKVATRDIPCTLSLHFLIRDDQLHLVAYMRSNDLILGFTYDVAIFTILQEKMLTELLKFYPLLKMGNYIHVTSSIHAYKRHFSLLKKIKIATKESPAPFMPPLDDISEIPTLLVNEAAIRGGEREKMKPLQHPFSLWCQKQLLSFASKKMKK